MLQIPDEKLKELILKNNLVSAEDFDSAAAEAERKGQTVSEVLLSQNMISGDYLNKLFADYFGVEQARLAARKINEEVLRLLPEDLARQKRAIVFGREADGTINVAMEDPTDLAAVEFIARYLKSRVKAFLASPEDLNLGFVYYGRRLASDFKKIIEENIQASLKAKIRGKEEKEAALEVPIVSIVDNLISYAMASRASDIHVEIFENDVLVRYRIDGMLREIMKIQKDVHPAIIARIKLLAGLKLDEHFKPQDGRFRYKVGTEFIDIRVSVMPTFYGEKIELRLLSSTAKPVSLEELGMFPDTIKTLKDNIFKTYGMVLATGPTGSGKSTTLYSILNILNRPEVNIVTVEDPIEYDMQYVNQTQINPQAGVTFASGLRALLRQDPNIIMVGEVRDEETAEIAVHAALTGHFVLSTLHTNDAVSAVPRLIDMKVQPFLAAAVLNAILAQRLVRHLCENCRLPYKPDEEIIKGLQEQFEALKLEAKFKPPQALYKAQGCDFCGYSGYKGRLGIFEIVNVTEDVRTAMVRPDFTLDFLKETIRKQGFISMFEDGLRKIESGLTTLEEVLRVIRE